MPEPKSLYQRIADVQLALDPVKATGHNQFQAVAVSIGDVEAALREPLATAGIVTRWSYVDLSQVDKALWQAHLKVTVASTDDPKDIFEDDWIDVGGNPMAATSFARKGYLKALFHMTEEADEKGVTATAEAPRRAAPRAVSSADDGPFAEGDACPACAELGGSGKFKVATGGRYKGALQCTGKIDGVWQNHLAPLSASEAFGDPDDIPF